MWSSFRRRCSIICFKLKRFICMIPRLQQVLLVRVLVLLVLVLGPKQSVILTANNKHKNANHSKMNTASSAKEHTYHMTANYSEQPTVSQRYILHTVGNTLRSSGLLLLGNTWLLIRIGMWPGML